MIWVYFMRQKFLSKNYKIKDMGETSYVIGIEILHDRLQGCFLYIFKMENCSASVVTIQEETNLASCNF